MSEDVQRHQRGTGASAYLCTYCCKTWPCATVEVATYGESEASVVSDEKRATDGGMRDYFDESVARLLEDMAIVDVPMCLNCADGCAGGCEDQAGQSCRCPHHRPTQPVPPADDPLHDDGTFGDGCEHPGTPERCDPAPVVGLPEVDVPDEEPVVDVEEEPAVDEPVVPVVMVEAPPDVEPVR